MKVYGLLHWYDERPDWLAGAVAAASRLCDGIVAVDGAYFLFPGSLRHPTSGAHQATTILETATALGMSCKIHVPDGPWLGNEVEKLEFLYNFAGGQPFEDWLFKFDADEQLSDCPADVRERLEATDKHVVELRMWERDAGGSLHPMWPIRRLYRVLPEMKVGPAHHMLSASVDGERIYLDDAEDQSRRCEALDMQDLRLEHRGNQRPLTRRENKDLYYRHRDELGIEKELVR